MICNFGISLSNIAFDDISKVTFIQPVNITNKIGIYTHKYGKYFIQKFAMKM